jgi:hypothetical protein
MRSLKSLMSLKSIFTSGLISFAALTACSSPPVPPTTSTSTTSTSTTSTPSPAPIATKSEPPKSNTNSKPSGEPAKPTQGGQVVEVGAYHLELVTVNEESGTHIDLFVQNGNDHSPIPEAKATAQVQLPDGTKQSLDLKYDDAGKHYATLLSEKSVGEYKVVILTEINGEKVNGRFSFKR